MDKVPLRTVELPSPDQAREQIDAVMAEAFAGNAVGLSVAVGYADEVIVSKGVGLAEVEHNITADSDTSFRIGSITKQFTAALVMRQVESGNLDLDASIVEYCDFPTGEHTVTVRHLLTHTSGIKSYTRLGKEYFDSMPFEFTHADNLARIQDLPFDFAPNENFLYNNSGYYLLGVILENVTGKNYAELITDEIAGPLGLARTCYGSSPDTLKNRAQGHRMIEGELANDEPIGMSQTGAAGALLSTAGDLVRWQQALVSGKVVSLESYSQMAAPHTLSDGSCTNYGFGFSIATDQDIPVIRHGGSINGFTSMLSYFPTVGLGVAVISNNEDYGAALLARDIARKLLGTEVEVVDLPVQSEEIDRLSGDYAFEKFPLEITVRGRGNQLFAQATNQRELRILRQGDGTYRASFDSDVVLEFEDGDPSPRFVLHQGGEFTAARKLETRK